MAKVKASGARGRFGFRDPNIDRIEVFRGYTTKNPLQLKDVRQSSKITSGNSGETKEKIIADFEKSARGRNLFAHGLPPIEFTSESLRHDFSQKNMSRQKLSIMRDYERMNYLLRNSTVLEKRIKTTSRSGKEKGKKKNWQHFWEVKGVVKIGNKLHSFTFSISQDKGKNTAKIYDFKLRKRK